MPHFKTNIKFYSHEYRVKISIFKAMVKPVAVCVGEIWALTEMDMNRLAT